MSKLNLITTKVGIWIIIKRKIKWQVETIYLMRETVKPVIETVILYDHQHLSLRGPTNSELLNYPKNLKIMTVIFVCCVIIFDVALSHLQNGLKFPL
jgi:hypothetical protein